MENATLASPETLYKGELCEIIAAKTGLPLEDVRLFYDFYHKEVMLALGAGKAVQIRGFGKFFARTAPARKAYNIQTDAVMDVPEKIKPEFKVGDTFKRVVARLFKGATKNE